jgi:hypothetical protein
LSSSSSLSSLFSSLSPSSSFPTFVPFLSCFLFLLAASLSASLLAFLSRLLCLSPSLARCRRLLFSSRLSLRKSAYVLSIMAMGLSKGGGAGVLAAVVDTPPAAGATTSAGSLSLIGMDLGRGLGLGLHTTPIVCHCPGHKC